MIRGAIVPAVFHGPNYDRTEKRVVVAVYDSTTDGTLVPVSFVQDGPTLALKHAPFGQTFVQYSFP